MKPSMLVALAVVLASSQSARAGDPACAAARTSTATEVAAIVAGHGQASLPLTFERGSAKLAGDSATQLAELAHVLDADPELLMEIGFAADVPADGDRAAKLASDRARTVRNALLAMGAPAQRLRAKSSASDTATAASMPASQVAQCASPGAPEQSSAGSVIGGS